MKHALADGGVAVVTLPGDVADLEATTPTPAWAPARPATLVPAPEVVDEMVRLIDAADKVAIFAGIGSRGAHDDILALAELIGDPVGHSLRGKDAIQHDNPFDVGMTGLLGYGAAAYGMQDADLLLLLGTDFPYDQFLPDTKTVQVDRDAARIGRRTAVDLPVHGDLLPTLQALLPRVARKRDRKFLKATLRRHEKLMTGTVGAYTKKPKKDAPIHPELVAAALDSLLADDAIVTADTGMCNVWTARYITPNGRRRLIGSFLHGSMANALPHALGAQFAYPGRQVVSVSGDGGLSMLLGELITAATYRLPVTAVVFNNSTLGMVKLEMLVEGLPDHGVDVPLVDYSGLARAMGLHSARVQTPDQIEPALRAALAHRGPALVEVLTDPLALSLPPQVTGEQMLGFATALSKVVMNGGAAEVVRMASSNLRNVPRGFRR